MRWRRCGMGRMWLCDENSSALLSFSSSSRGRQAGVGGWGGRGACSPRCSLTLYFHVIPIPVCWVALLTGCLTLLSAPLLKIWHMSERILVGFEAAFMATQSSPPIGHTEQHLMVFENSPLNLLITFSVWLARPKKHLWSSAYFQ